MTLMYDKVRRLRDTLRNNKANIYPLVNHPLAKQDEYMKGLYMKVLCMAVQYCRNLQEEHSILLQRLIIGIDEEHNMQDYMRMALESDESLLFDFLENFRDNQLKYPFVLDCLVVANCTGQATQEQHEFIAELSEQLRMSKNDIYYLSLLAQCILEQDSDKYLHAEEFRPSGIPFQTFWYFTEPFVSVFVSRKDEDCYISSKEKMLFEFSSSFTNITNDGYSVAIHSPSIYLNNLIIDTQKHQMIFSSSEYVYLRNCEFMGSSNSVLFKDCKKVVLEGCTFRDFSGKTIIVEQIEDLLFSECKFDNCIWQYSRSTYDWQVLGAVIHANTVGGIEKCIIDGCTFRNCGGANTQKFYSTAIISNCMCTVRNSAFINCWNRNRNGIDPADHRRTLFIPDTHNENNHMIESASFAY